MCLSLDDWQGKRIPVGKDERVSEAIGYRISALHSTRKANRTFPPERRHPELKKGAFVLDVSCELRMWSLSGCKLQGDDTQRL